MELTQLKQFKIAAECSHISNAAEKLHITQPALSQSISKLEDELGVPLFLRTKNRVVLNENGQLVLSYVNKILAELNEMELALRRKASVSAVQVVSVNKANLRYSVPSLAKKYPELMVSTAQLPSEQIEDSLLRGESDLAFSYEAYGGAISSVLLCQERLKLSFSEADPRGSSAGVPLSALEGDTIMLPKECGLLVKTAMEHMKQKGIKANFVKQKDDIMLTNYMQFSNPYVIFIGGVAQKYRTNYQRRIVPVIDPVIQYSVYLSFLREKETQLAPIVAFLRHIYQSISK